MVNKIAVAAIVAIIAVPILIGYGMNLEETTVTEYIETENPTNVTQLLKNGTGYTFVHADPYRLNTDFTTGGKPALPAYASIIDSSSSLKASVTSATGTNVIGGAVGPIKSNYSYLYVEADYMRSDGSITLNAVTFDGGNWGTFTVTNFHSAYYDFSDNKLYVTTYLDDTTVSSPTAYDNVYSLSSYSKVGSYNGYMYMTYDYKTNSKYVDLSGGFRLCAGANELQSIGLPNMTKTAIMTVNLDSVSAANYNFNISIPSAGNFSLYKRTVSGVVSWEARHGSTHIPIYYDPNRSDNSYQIVMSMEKTQTTDTRVYYDTTYEIRYVGGWPNSFGEANYYQKYEITLQTSRLISNANEYLGEVRVGYTNAPEYPTPIIRMDDALYAGFEYPVIQDNEYTPGDYKTNPLTMIKDVNLFGSAIEFAGNTYSVDSSGNITLGIHKVSVNGIVLDSVPTTGGYNNRINGITISTTVTPSTIKFVGQWLANVSTDSLTTNTYNHTQWHAGEFAWDGIDSNFLIIGLITSLASLVVLGIYARISNSGGVIPLMIVCGGAAILFFVML